MMLCCRCSVLLPSCSKVHEHIAVKCHEPLTHQCRVTSQQTITFSYAAVNPQKSHRCVDLTTGHSAIHFVVSDIHGALCAAGDGATCGTGWTDESSGALVSWRHVSMHTRTFLCRARIYQATCFCELPRFLAVCQTSGCQSLKPRVGALCRSWVFLLVPWHHSKLPCSRPGGTSSAGNRRSARDDRMLVSGVQVARKLR